MRRPRSLARRLDAAEAVALPQPPASPGIVLIVNPEAWARNPEAEERRALATALAERDRGRRRPAPPPRVVVLLPDNGRYAPTDEQELSP